jgi:hypothetical protein
VAREWGNNPRKDIAVDPSLWFEYALVFEASDRFNLAYDII